MKLTADILKLAFYPGEAHKFAAYTTQEEQRNILFPKDRNGFHDFRNNIPIGCFVDDVEWNPFVRNILVTGVAIVALSLLAAAYTATHPAFIVLGTVVGLTVSAFGGFYLYLGLSRVDQALELSEPDNIMHSPGYLAFRA